MQSNGALGKPILEALLQSNKFNITILTRSSSTSTSTYPSSATVLPVDFNSTQSLTDALQSQKIDAIVSCVGTEGLLGQKLEEEWLALVDEASRNARDLEQRIKVVELYDRAIRAEPWSNPLWLARCDWVLSLYTDCRDPDAGWPEDERLVGQELFTLQTAQDLWQEGRFFSYLSLFTFMMIVLVTANNFLLMFVG
ncbi:NAD(P)H-binding protein [Bacillus velezensis]|uniref:NAD(P)H-binding protein n=1 Tax=Bacillus velezensis TaxID=492670 RepID=UPI003C6CB6CD